MEPEGFDKFIQVDRTFHMLTSRSDGGEEVETFRGFREPEPLGWPELLKENRVIILSEAGSGKTQEIRNVAQTLRKEGKTAFFLRIENVIASFEDAFEEGSIAEFNQWIASGESGWLLLDSVDEARLRDPRDFELAIRRIARLLGAALQQAYIVITGRTTAWRATTDRMICETCLPFRRADITAAGAAERDEGDGVAVAVQKTGTESSGDYVFMIVALDELRGPQVDKFALGKNVNDLRAFRAALDRKEAWPLTTRPMDLAELVEFWNKEGRIGSRLELLKSSIDRRLKERDQNRADVHPISVEKLRKGARLVAAATTLCREAGIRVPDGSQNSKGVAVREMLTGWDDKECNILLSRPIFDEGIYGTVRFHHRSVREYLTAEWLHELIVNEGSRRRVENLFFRTQYEMDVIVPTMRPILPWLAILDPQILGRVSKLAPEVLFEGGDPSQLPVDKRREILRQACEQLAQPARGRSITDYSAVQRFANADLTDDINTLLDQYGEDDDIAWFLLRMIWQGEIKGGAETAKRFALNSTAHYTRIGAFRAIATVGSASDQKDVREAFLAAKGDVSRDWLSELTTDLPRDAEGVSWLMRALERAPGRPQFQVDRLSEALPQFTDELPIWELPKFVEGLDRLLGKPPFIERRHCELSRRYRWILPSASRAIVRLIEARAPSAFGQSVLSILRKLPNANHFDDGDLKNIIGNLPKLVAEWSELNHSLFWDAVAETRATRLAAQEGPLVEFWYVGVLGKLWSFRPDAFEAVCEDVAGRTLLDDRLVALSLAFTLYRENERPRKWRQQLHRLVSDEPALKASLHAFLNPPARGKQKWRVQEAHWKRQRARELERKAAHERDWKAYLEANVGLLRNPGESGTLTNAPYYLYQRIQAKHDLSDKLGTGNWESLTEEFGEDIARAWRDGAVKYWRTHQPKLISEGAPENTTFFTTIYGLIGLGIEARENPDWLSHLTEGNAESAARYAVYEMNGFPSWLPALQTAFPSAVLAILEKEIDYELAHEAPEGERYGVLSRVSWNSDQMADGLARYVIAKLGKPPRNSANVRFLLDILMASSIDSKVIARLAARKATATSNALKAPIWYAAWICVEPAVGIPALAARLASLKNSPAKTLFAMHFLTELFGARGGKQSSRQSYRTVEHAKTLFLMMQEYIREVDDIERAGKGVYTPGLRDRAQDARNALFSFLRETPGKEAFFALVEISHSHPESSSRPWMAFHAKEKATLDAEPLAWSPEQVRDFHAALERTPSNHRDLWDLAIDRLLDLKSDLETGDSSIASLLQRADRETELRNFIGNWCRERSGGRYGIPQEEELANAQKPDLRFHGVGFDGPVPAELKIADNWTGPHLLERLEVQLCGDYLRDQRSGRGIFILVYRGVKSIWELPNGKAAKDFDALVDALQSHWVSIGPRFPGIEDIRVIGIDLTKRSSRPATISARGRNRQSN